MAGFSREVVIGQLHKTYFVKLIHVEFSWSNKFIILKSFFVYLLKSSLEQNEGFLIKTYLFPLEVLVNENIIHYCL